MASSAPPQQSQQSQQEPDPGYWQRSLRDSTAAADRAQQFSQEHGGPYHQYLLAEFMACIVMIIGSLILLPAGGSTDARSYARQLVQLTAVCLVFFVLALASAGPKTGKVGAAFGGLVTLGVAWHLSEMWSALTKALGGQAHTNTPSKSGGKG